MKVKSTDIQNSRRKYDREFKIEAIRLVTEGGRRVSEVARDLGIHENLLYNWRRKYLVVPEKSFNQLIYLFLFR